MRKFILITAMVLVSAAAHAGRVQRPDAGIEPAARGGRASQSWSNKNLSRHRKRSKLRPPAKRLLMSRGRGCRYGDRSAEGGDDQACHRESYANVQARKSRSAGAKRPKRG